MGHQLNYNWLSGCRYLVLICEAGETTNESHGVRVIRGTMKLAKLDFLLRYPEYLTSAVGIISPSQVKYWRDNPTEPMAKYLMGPFEKEMYDVFGILDSRGLTTTRGHLAERSFYITEQGRQFVQQALYKDERYEAYREVAEVVGRFFGRMTGPELKSFLYKHFPDIENTGIDTMIPTTPRKMA